MKNLVESALPPSQVVPPVDVIYADKERIAVLYSEAEPALVEKAHTFSSESKSARSFGIERKPLELKANGSTKQIETQSFKSADASASREGLDLVNNLLARQFPPYYSTFNQLSSFQILSQARQVLGSAQETLKSRSLFAINPPDPGAVATLRRMNEIRKSTPPAVIEKAIRAQLSGLSGLVIVQGDFNRTSLGDDGGQFEESFKSDPHPIVFRFSLRDTKALGMLPNHVRLFILADVIKKWDGGSHLDFFPIAIFSGAGRTP